LVAVVAVAVAQALLIQTGSQQFSQAPSELPQPQRQAVAVVKARSIHWADQQQLMH
jgi:hypothetical protein